MPSFTQLWPILSAFLRIRFFFFVFSHNNTIMFLGSHLGSILTQSYLPYCGGHAYCSHSNSVRIVVCSKQQSRPSPKNGNFHSG